jgi:hypothetical protein
VAELNNFEEAEVIPKVSIPLLVGARGDCLLLGMLSSQVMTEDNIFGDTGEMLKSFGI